MSELERILSRFRDHAGVQHVLVLGRDGLLIRHAGDAELDADATAAMIPEITAACATLGSAAGCGEWFTVAIEFSRGVAVVAALSPNLLLTLLLEPGVGFAPLLADVRRQRPQLAALL